MKIINNNKIKDYEILEQPQKEKKKENELQKKNSQDISDVNSTGFIIGLSLLIVLVCLVYKYFILNFFQNSNDNKSNQLYQSNNETQSNQFNESEQLNDEAPKTQDIKFYEIEKKEEINITKYLKFLPVINGDTSNNITSLSSIFESKVLYIKDVNITKEYIAFLRKNDEEYDQRNNEHIFFEPYDPNYIISKEDKLTVEEFYKLCDQKEIDYVNNSVLTEFPFISIIIPIYNKNLDLVKTLRSIQYQTFKNLEIIIVDDVNTNHKELYNSLFKKEPRLRLFTQSKNRGIWKKRLDGYLYSRGKYILHMNPGDILADNYVIDDVCNISIKYQLSSVRFSYSKTKYDKNFKIHPKFEKMNIYDMKYIQILFGDPEYDIYEKGFGNIWNIIVRSNVYTDGLDSTDEYIINAYNDVWENMMWNFIINKISLSNLVINRLGYINLYNPTTEIAPQINTKIEKNKTIRELIYFWLLDYLFLKKEEDNKKERIIEILKNFTDINNIYCNLKINLNYLDQKYVVYEHLLTLLMNDKDVSEDDKKYVELLYNKYLNIKEENEEKKEEKKDEKKNEKNIKSNELNQKDTNKNLKGKSTSKKDKEKIDLKKHPNEKDVQKKKEK